MYHLKGSPADPNRLYASQSNSWFGHLIQRSDDGGETWQPVGNRFEYAGVPGTPRPWEFKHVRHLEPSLEDPDTTTRGSRTARCFARQMADGRGKSCAVSASTALARTGSPVPAVCVCTRSSWTVASRSGSSSRFRRRVPSDRTTAATRGYLSTEGCIRRESRIQTPK